MSAIVVHGFTCPNCGSDKCRVIDSRSHGAFHRRRRRRLCEKCEHRFTTVELTYADYEALIGNTALRDLRKELVDVIDRKTLRIVPKPVRPEEAAA